MGLPVRQHLWGLPLYSSLARREMDWPWVYAFATGNRTRMVSCTLTFQLQTTLAKTG